MKNDSAPVLPLWAALILAAASGAVIDAGFPDKGVWPLTFAGLLLLLGLLPGRRAGSAFLLGFVAGASFYLIHVSWTALYLGPVPWFALSILEALFFALGAMLIALAYRWVPRLWSGPVARMLLLPLVVAGLWTLREAVSSSWPYGGFAWGRLALSQSESPFAPLVAWVGVSGLTFIMVLLTATVLQFIRESTLELTPRLALPAAAIALTLAVPAWPVISFGTTTVAAVQGNGPAGYFDQRDPGDVLTAQASATLPLIGQNVDMVVWPENGTDLDPLQVDVAASTLDYLSSAIRAPIITGAITQRGDELFNTSLLWKPGEGPVDYYDKRRPVPFGEYVPDRSFWEPFAPDLIGLIAREYTPGTRDNVFDVNGVIAGISICFDIVDDGLTREAVGRGAQLLIAQTNNADFGRTDENQQQLAIARMRAIESSRSIVNVSTVGTSQMIDPTGRTLTEIPAFEPGSMVFDVPLASGTTPAMAIGGQLEWLLGLSGFGALLIAGAFGRRSTRAKAGRPRNERPAKVDP